MGGEGLAALALLKLIERRKDATAQVLMRALYNFVSSEIDVPEDAGDSAVRSIRDREYGRPFRHFIEVTPPENPTRDNLCDRCPLRP